MKDSLEELLRLANEVRYATEDGVNTAEKVGRIFVGILNLVNSDDFLSKIHPDTAQELITFLKGWQTGGFVSGLFGGHGAAVDANGNAEVESIKVRSAIEVLELIINRLSAIEGDQILTESDTIERVEDLGGGIYGLHLRSKWNGYFTAMRQGSVIKGIINTLAGGSGQYYTSWMRVNSVNTAANYIEVTMYPDEETPAGRNYPPSELMRIARWGHQTDPRFQSCLYLSSTEGRIVRQSGVTKPITDDTNIGATFGSLPEFLKTLNLPLAEGQDYFYARGIVVEDLIQIDYKGRPISDIVDRGSYRTGVTYYHETLNADTGRYEISDVWHYGCKWRCQKTGTTAEPRWDSTDWAFVEGNPYFSVDFAEADFLVDPDNVRIPLTIIAKLYNQDVTADILDNNVEWTRYSEDANGVPRVASDNAWAIRRAGAGKSIVLTAEDFDFGGYMPKTIRFTATVTFRDGLTDAVSYEY